MYRSSSRGSRSKSRFNIGRTSNRVGVQPTANRESDVDIKILQQKYTDISKIYNSAIKLATRGGVDQEEGAHQGYATAPVADGRRPSWSPTANPGRTQRQKDERRSMGYSGRPQSGRPQSATAARPQSAGYQRSGSGGGGSSGSYRRTLVYTDKRTQVYSSNPSAAEANQRRAYRPQSASSQRGGGRPGSATSHRSGSSSRKYYAAGSGAAAAGGRSSSRGGYGGVRSGGSAVGGGDQEREPSTGSRGYARPTSAARQRHERPSSAHPTLPAQYRQYDLNGNYIGGGPHPAASGRQGSQVSGGAGASGASSRQQYYARGGATPASYSGGGQGQPGGDYARAGSSGSWAPQRGGGSGGGGYPHPTKGVPDYEQAGAARYPASSGGAAGSRHNVGVRTGSRRPPEGPPPGYKPSPRHSAVQHQAKRMDRDPSEVSFATAPARGSTPTAGDRQPPLAAAASAQVQKASSFATGNAEHQPQQLADEAPRPSPPRAFLEAEGTGQQQEPAVAGGRGGEDGAVEGTGAVAVGTASGGGARKALARPDSAIAMKRSRDLTKGGLVSQGQNQADGRGPSPAGAGGADGAASSSSSLAGLLDQDEDSGEELPIPQEGMITKSKQLGASTVGGRGSRGAGKWAAEARGGGGDEEGGGGGAARPRPQSASAANLRQRQLEPKEDAAGGAEEPAAPVLSARVVRAVSAPVGEGTVAAAPAADPGGAAAAAAGVVAGVRSGGAAGKPAVPARPQSAVARVQTQRRADRMGSVESTSNQSHGQRNQVGRRVWAHMDSHSTAEPAPREARAAAAAAAAAGAAGAGAPPPHNESVESNPQSAPARPSLASRQGSLAAVDEKPKAPPAPPELCPQAAKHCTEAERRHAAQVMRDLVRRQGVSSLEFYELGAVLGTGSFAKVREGFHKPTGSRVAVKTYDKAKIKDANQRRRIQQEIRLMEKLNHPRVVRHFEVLETQNRIHLVMECCGGGNLCAYLKRKRRLDEGAARTLLRQVLDGLRYMHDLNVVHRDIKLENVLLDADGSAKLVDFGFSAYAKDKKLKIFCGTPSYMAPEIIKRKEYHGKPVDVWSLGVVLYAMVCGRFPFSGKSYSELYRSILQGQFRLPEQLSGGVRDLLRRMLVLDPAQRWDLGQVWAHPWTQQGPDAPRHAPQPGKVELTIHEDPREDVDEAVVRRLGGFGVKRDVVVSCLLRKVHNCVTTTYYLLRAALYNQHLRTSQFADHCVTADKQ